MKANTVAIEQLIDKALTQIGFKSRRSGNGSGSGGGSYVRSDMNCHKCGKKIHINKDCRSNVNGSGGNSPKNSTNDLPEWVTKNPVLSDNKYLATSTMTHNKKEVQVVHLFQ